MKKKHILAVAIATAMVSSFAVAQTTAHKASQKIDANGDAVITRAEAARYPRLAENFDKLDVNKDGKLSAAERPQHRRSMRRGEGRMQNADTDKDGRISKAEAQATAARFASRFDEMDVNADGYIDSKDRQLRAAQARAEFFAGADANTDGRLSRDEFIVERSARSAERREQLHQRAEAAGRTTSMKQPDEAERIQRIGVAFDRMDTNKDGVVSKAEYEAFKPMRVDGKRARRSTR